ncbi:MAG: hypothetical protein RI897_175 [Verrucomicrobiota bacterium]
MVSGAGWRAGVAGGGVVVAEVVIDDAGRDDVGTDIDRGAGHIEDTVEAEDEEDTFGGEAEVGEQAHHDWE